MEIELKLLTTVYISDEQLVTDWLEGAGIEVFKRSKAFASLEIAVGPLAEVNIYVRPEQYEDACRVLAAMNWPGGELA